MWQIVQIGSVKIEKIAEVVIDREYLKVILLLSGQGLLKYEQCLEE